VSDNGCLPLNKDHYLKVWGQTIFSNTLTNLSTGEAMSMPPMATDYRQQEVPQALKEDVAFGIQAIFGRQGEGLEVQSHRICWYVPKSRNLTLMIVLQLLRGRDMVWKTDSFLI